MKARNIDDVHVRIKKERNSAVRIANLDVKQ
jgi:hypothetical protein